MGMITLVMLGLTAVGLGFGALFGLMRGRNRAILRLIMVAVCVVVAIVLRGPLTKVVMGININGQTLEQTLLSLFNQGEMTFPESVQTLVLSLVEIIVGLLAYFIAFFALRSVTWAVVFPICKIFVHEGEKMHRGHGALIGLAQGVIVVFAVMMPLNGLIVQFDKIADIKMQDKPLLEIPANVGLEEYVNGPMGKTYSAIGGWYFNMLTSADTLKFDDLTDMVVVAGNLAGSISGINESMDVLQSDTASTQEKADALVDVGNRLIEVGEDVDNLSDEAKAQIDSLLGDLKEMVGGGEESSEEMDEFFNDLSLDDINIGGMGHALVGIGSLMEKEEGEEINQEDVNHIVIGLATNMKFVDMMTGGEDSPTLVSDLDEEQKTMFENAIAEQELSSEDEASLRKLLGLTDTSAGE